MGRCCLLLPGSKAREGSMLCFGFAVCFSVCTCHALTTTLTHTPVLAQTSFSGVCVLHKLKEFRLSEAKFVIKS